jgi:Co/Zn/Cd efflux system component
MFIGNIALVAAAFLVYKSIGWSIADLIYWLVIGLLIGARYIDIARLQGTTIHLEPATTGHFKRYLLVVMLGGAGLFVTARALGPGF